PTRASRAYPRPRARCSAQHCDEDHAVTAARPRVALLDYGLGNVHSAAKALEAAGAEVSLTADRATVMEADGLVVPGVGSIAACMAGIQAIRGGELIGRRLAGTRPVLGICVGMQVLFSSGEEGGVHTDALDEWPGTVRRLRSDI